MALSNVTLDIKSRRYGAPPLFLIIIFLIKKGLLPHQRLRREDLQLYEFALLNFYKPLQRSESYEGCGVSA
jgi:hypothetical protein